MSTTTATRGEREMHARMHERMEKKAKKRFSAGEGRERETDGFRDAVRRS